MEGVGAARSCARLVCHAKGFVRQDTLIQQAAQSRSFVLLVNGGGRSQRPHVEILTLQGLQKSHPARAPAYSASERAFIRTKFRAAVDTRHCSAKMPSRHTLRPRLGTVSSGLKSPLAHIWPPYGFFKW
jgi:hypothetical protein